METVGDFISGGSKITAVQMVTAAMKLKDTLTNLDSILKSRDITLLINAHIVTTMVFPVVMHRCENYTIKKAEHQKIDAFELWVGEGS